MTEALPCSLGTLVREAKRRLTHLEDPALEARLIVEHFTGTTRTDAVTTPERAVNRASAEAVLAAVARRCAGTPVHRIFGYREFYGLKLELSPQTLEPRPDTEAVVDLALPEARRISAESGRCRILDLGTGTGAIALALLSMVPEADAIGADISDEALATARANADINGYAARFAVLKTDWWSAVNGMFDLIVSNPPYIPTDDMETLAREVREHDPHVALDGGVDGLDFYRRIAGGAHSHLSSRGAIVVETGYDQKAVVQAVFTAAGYRTAGARRDLGGRDRAILFKPTGSQ